MKTASLLCTLWLTPLSWSQSSAPVTLTEAPADLGRIYQDFVETLDPARKTETLALLARTAPTTARDVESLLDLFTRFPSPVTREAVMSSLHRLDPGRQYLEPLFLSYLRQSEAETVLFGINGALQLRATKALPMIREIAKKKFPGANSMGMALTSEKNAWWVQYEALSALAQWDGDKSYRILAQQTTETPAVAELMGRYLWKKSLAQIIRWAESSDKGDRDRATLALAANPSAADLRATRDEMLRVVRDVKAEPELRHQLALKVGLCSTDPEAEALLKEHDASTDAKTQSLLAAALFVSKSAAAIPLLKKYATQDPNPAVRAAAQEQLNSFMKAN